MTVFVKIAGQHMETIQIVFMRGVITLIFSYILIKRNNVYLWGNNKKILGEMEFSKDNKERIENAQNLEDYWISSVGKTLFDKLSN